MKSRRVRTAMAVVLCGVGVAWSPGRSSGQCCGDCNGNGTVAINELITAVNRSLKGCQDDGICTMETCPAQLATCRDDLAGCRSQTGCRAFPASGQTTAYGPGSDGDVQAGATLSYTDNGDGTITDNNTGLMWEKKDDSGGIHDQDNNYTWWGGVSEGYLMDGTMVTEFLDTLNAGGGFARHTDWRIPNVRELQSIVDYEIPYPGPVVNAAFHNAAGCTGCTDVTLASCGCTRSYGYWSSTTTRNDPNYAWNVLFDRGYVLSGSYLLLKYLSFAVRAVRAGL